MSRYYHNENPQVRHWMGKCALLQEELDCAIDQLETMACCKGYTEKRLEELKYEIKRFNVLPWYKKMFYKFDV